MRNILLILLTSVFLIFNAALAMDSVEYAVERFHLCDSTDQNQVDSFKLFMEIYKGSPTYYNEEMNGTVIELEDEKNECVMRVDNYDSRCYEVFCDKK